MIKQSALYKTAVILHALGSAFNIFTAWPALVGGPDSAGMAEGVPQVLLVFGALLGVAGLISSYGAWQGQKWGVWLTVLVELVGELSALPGILIAPTEGARILAIVGVLIAVFVIIGLFWRR